MKPKMKDGEFDIFEVVYLNECSRLAPWLAKQIRRIGWVFLDNHFNHNGYTPLTLASLMGNIDCMKALLSAGSSINHTAQRGETPMHCAVVGGSLEAVKYLFEYQEIGARWSAFEATDKDGRTALQIAAALSGSNRKRNAIFRYLVAVEKRTRFDSRAKRPRWI